MRNRNTDTRVWSRIHHKGATSQDVRIWCPVVPPPRGFSWQRLTAFYADPDGSADGATVFVHLNEFSMDGMHGPVQQITPSLINSDDLGVLGWNEASVTFNHEFKWESHYYEIRVTLRRNPAALDPANCADDVCRQSFIGVRLSAR